MMEEILKAQQTINEGLLNGFRLLAANQKQQADQLDILFALITKGDDNDN